MSKQLLAVFRSPHPHLVGDMPARTLFSYDRLGQKLSPFLLLDYAGPHEFEPAERQRGVGEHPHRGFETVTVVYRGEMAHRDSAGNAGTIGAGDVQWMTAASGVMHEEFFSPAFNRAGGPFKVAQLWVNLPAGQKMSAPRYQDIRATDIPTVELPGGAGRMRVIAGEAFGARGPAQTVTELNVWDAALQPGELTLPVPAGHNAAIAVLGGSIKLPGGEQLGDGDSAIYDPAGAGIALKTLAPTTLLVMTGVPIEEPIAGYGPFVMNTREQIIQAFEDVNAGRFGRLA